MSDIIFMKLLFVAGLLGLAVATVLLGYAMTWRQGRRTVRHVSGRREASTRAAGGTEQMWRTR